MEQTKQTLIKHAKGGALSVVMLVITGLLTALFLPLLIFSIAQEPEMIGFFAFVVISFGACFGVLLYCRRSPARIHVFRKYGNADQVTRMVDEALNDPAKIYDDKNIIVSQKYIMMRNRYISILKLEDLLAVYPFTQSYNFVPVAAGLQVTDKWGEQQRFVLGLASTKANEIIEKMMPYCPNTSFGFSAQTNQYVKQNKIPLPPKISQI